MVNVLNLLFDGRILKWGLSNGTRNGIYFVAKNIIQMLAKQPKVCLNLYLPDADLPMAADLFNSIDLKPIKVFSDNDDLSDINAFLSPLERYPDIIKKYPNVSCYTILHDVIPLIFPEYFQNCDNEWFHRLITSLNSEDYYFTNSDYTKSDFLKYFPNMNSDNITTMLLSTNLEYKPNKDKNKLSMVYKKYNIPNDKKYLFSLCSLEQRKNLVRAVKCFVEFIKKNNIDDLVFVLGGGAWGDFVERLEKEVPDYINYSDKIIRAGYVDDEDLSVLYSNAQWFVYTSQYEGFGMPPLEAMSCGCPVITSNNTSLPEVVGDAGQMVDWDNDEQHVIAYEKYYFDNDFRMQMGEKGLERSKQFSWQKAVYVILKKMFDTENKKSNQPLVSIITPTFNLIKNNRKETFIQSLLSAHNQTYKNIEHIVIDGASDDETIDLLKEYQNQGLITYYSEPDYGLYDAINKGILKAKGKYIVVLNSDDFYCDIRAVEMLVKKAEETNADAVCASANTLNPDTGEIVSFWDSCYTKWLIFGYHACHQTFLIKTDVMKELGLYDLEYKVSADTAFMFKMLQSNKHIVMIEPAIITYRLGGVSADVAAVKADVSKALFKNYGQYHNLTRLDANNLTHDSFVYMTLDKAMVLGSKLEKQEWRKYFFEKLINHQTNSIDRQGVVAQTQPDAGAKNPAIAKIYQYNLFDYIPLLKTKTRYNVKRWLLFCFLPILKNKYIGETIESYLFGFIPLMLRDKMNHIDYKEIVPGVYNFSGVLPFESNGLFYPEDWGRWSDGNETSFFVKTDKKYIAQFNVHAFLTDNKTTQKLTVYINNREKQKHIFEQGKESSQIVIKLPKSKKLHIMFKYEDVKSPADLGVSEDNRKIAIGFESVEIKKDK